MRIYIAGPMRGIENFNYPAFDLAETALQKLGHVCFNPARNDREKHGVAEETSATGDESFLKEKYNLTIRDFLHDDLVWICKEADAIALLPGWRNSKGANAEYATAIAIGIEIFYLDSRGVLVENEAAQNRIAA